MAKITKTIFLGEKSKKISFNVGMGHTEYSGYGIHDKLGRDRNREIRRKGKREAQEIARNYR